MKKIDGLSNEEVENLRQKFGLNTLFSKRKVSWVKILIDQFKSPMIYILLAVGLISFLLNEKIDGSLALAVLVVNVLMGFYQEFSASKTLQALQKILKPTALVIREGKRFTIDARQLVPDDYVVIAAGDRVPADGSLVEGEKILVNESILTGEEEALPKSEINSPNLFMGTTIISGKGLMKVEKIGAKTEMGKIGQSLEEIKDAETPLQKRLNHFVKSLAVIILIVCFLIFIAGIFYGQGLWQTLKVATILSIAAMPEALPIALTVILALGMRRILKRKGLVRKLLAIETLGSTSVICTDKTGTLTEGNMKVVKLESDDPEMSLRVMILDNEQKTNLEIALWDYVKKTNKFDPQKLYEKFEKIDEEPFDSEKKYSLSVNKVEGKKVTHLMGAPEKIISFCDLDEEKRKEIIQKIDAWAEEGLRILGLAYKKEGRFSKKNFTWLGLVGIKDPLRAEAKEAIAYARDAGIKVKIVTGDYQKTAEKVTKALGFNLTPENILEGDALEKMTEGELAQKIDDIILFSRILPHQKLKIVKVLQEKGEVVAMTGDGVNDAPALKKADIGVSVNNATDVSKEASDLVLLDNNFKTIIAACREGRLILSNIKKVVGYVLSNSFAEIILIFGAMILNFQPPLLVVQILWIHLICDGPPDILLGFEPEEEGIMAKTPQEVRNEKILTPQMKILIFSVSAIIGILALVLFWHFEKTTGDIELARTIAFATIGLVSLIYIFSFKNLKKSIFEILAKGNLFNNVYLILGVVYGLLLIVVAIYIPFFNRLLETVPLGLSHWLLVFLVAIVATAWIEMMKFLERKNTDIFNQGY